MGYRYVKTKIKTLICNKFRESWTLATYFFTVNPEHSPINFFSAVRERQTRISVIRERFLKWKRFPRYL